MLVHDDPEFGDLIRIAAGESNLTPGLVEKDYWVTHTLWALRHQGFKVWFKGGTSLSKGFGLIQRFSEDLDLKIEAGTVAGVSSVANWKSEGTKAIKERETYFGSLARTIQIEGARIQLSPDYSDPAFRSTALQVLYPGRYLSGLSEILKPFVLLEIGNARVTPFVPCDMTSFVHETLKSRNQLGNYDDNRPLKVRCIHPLVTLLEKLDALHRRVPRHDVDPGVFVRHFEDTAHIIRAGQSLPPLGDYPNIRALAAEMLKYNQIAELPSSTDPAFQLAVGERMDAIHSAWHKIAPMFWGPRISLEESCSMIRMWINTNF